MNSTNDYRFPHDTASGVESAEATLRLIASAPVPEGLAERVQAGLRAAPPAMRVLRWPTASLPAGGWMRGAAAAAIVAVVAGGGWGVCTRVQMGQPARVIAMPPRMAAPGGFSSAGAMRTPRTLNGLEVAHLAAGVKSKALSKRTAQTPLRHGQQTQPVTPR